MSAMKKRTARCNSDTVKQEGSVSNGNPVDPEIDNDISLLQRPLRTAHTGFEEAWRAYDNGTNEVRRLLTQECSLIYECNVCRNMFRSLANFISHKRVFCCLSARTVNQNGYADQNSSMIIQTGNGPSSQDIEHMLRSRSTGCSPVPREARPIRGSMRDLSGVIERLRREKAPSTVPSSPTVLQLESVPTSSQAVYQTVKREHADSIKTEINEVHDMLNNDRTIVGPDGKALTSNQYERQGGGSDSGETAEQSVSDETETNIICEICNLTFQTNKTLEVHIQKHHSSSAFVFQCPACSLTFLQAAAVIRHLSKDHKKPTRRIRMMRNTILKRRVQQGNVQPKGPSRELKRLKLSDDVVGYEPEAADVASEQRKIMSLCIYCEKSFERRAALSTHLLNCRAKQKALAKPAPSVRKLKSKLTDSTDAVEDDAAAPAEPSDASIKHSLDQAADDVDETDTNALNEMFADLAEQNDAFAARLQTVSLDKLQLRESDSASDESSTSEDEQERESGNPIGSNESKTNDPQAPKIKKKRQVPIEKQLRCSCKICHKQFNALGNLRRHISMFHYRARRFGCTMCDYRAFRRYDIVNHLGFTHKIEGDREQLTKQYVSTHECKYSRDDVDGDIVVLGKEEDPAPSSPPNEDNGSAPAERRAPKTYEKRLKRVKTISETPIDPEPEPMLVPETIDELAVEVKEELVEHAPHKKRRKSRTQLSPDSGEHQPRTLGSDKRPIRKRVKAVNKDFVYDLVSFKADAASSQQAPPPPAPDSMRAKLRRQNGAATADENKPKLWEDYITEAKHALIQGSTRRVMLELVRQGRAVSATLPELPAERPQIRPRLTSQARSECGQRQPVLDIMNSSSSESFIEKIAKRTAAAGKDAAAINNLWNKVNTVIAQQKLEPEQATTTVQLEDQKTPNGKHNAVSQLSPPSPPRTFQAIEPQATTSPTPAQPLPVIPKAMPTTMPASTVECLSNSNPAHVHTSLFPALPKPPSVLAEATSGTIQLTLDSLLRAALQN
ncbi:zinc finger protein 800 [Scaptodrosophila lebanonensis]|uniref:Zinc finger protein 800 n=1 Tax=Drosophila lebanonensis TaxID=7225 RepID=A0A6J2T1V9_DROLE|nr:zinc finger protein 800 [Scaptodrosophila lebanonensis]